MDDVQDAIAAVLTQKRGEVIEQGTADSYQIKGTVNGVEYLLGLNNGHIGQFYPTSQK